MALKHNISDLKEKDLYSIILYSIYKLTGDPQYSTISELIYTLNKDSLLNLCSVFGGCTIKIPTIDSNRKLQKEDKAVIIGTPYEQKKSILEGTVKDMDLSVKKTDGVYQSYVTDITIQDSINGFMFSGSGNLEAVILRNMQEEDTAGIITAVPISEIKTRVQDICNGSPAVYLGIDGDDITDEVKQQVDKNMPYGVYIKQCVPDSPAYRSGILAGDIIISINDESIKNMRDIKIALDNCETGKEKRSRFPSVFCRTDFLPDRYYGTD